MVMKPKDLRISIVTCQREPQYIHRTIASLFTADKHIYKVGSIDIFVDGPETTFLRQYWTHATINIHYLSKEEQLYKASLHKRLDATNKKNKIHMTPRHINCSLGHYRARNVDMDGYKALMVLEDDVTLRNNFIDNLSDVYTELKKDKIPHWSVSLQDNQNVKGSLARYRGKYYISYPGERFYGFTGTFLPAQTVEPVRDVIKDYGMERAIDPADLCMHRLAGPGKLLGQGFFCSAWDITSHEGEVSTGLGGGRGSNNWHIKWRPLTKADFRR
jgi:hypothetical protein